VSTLEVLRSARALLDLPGTWCQDALARDAEGNDTPYPIEPAACCWCIGGAIEKVLGRGLTQYDEPVVHALLAEIPERASWSLGALFTWNDSCGRTHADVIALLDRAISTAETR
jgi:hypothetical protein